MNQHKNYLSAIFFIGILFFIFGFVTWLNGTLIPYLKIVCELNNFQAYFVTFAFYISYFVMAIPSGWLLYHIGFKNGIVFGLVIMSIGTLIFIPAAYTRNYMLFLTGLFTQGIGLALLQTAVNPYVTKLGPIESAAQRISIMGLCNKFAGILGPLIFGLILLQGITHLNNQLAIVDLDKKNLILNQLSLKIIFPYFIMALVLLVMAISFFLLPLQNIDENNHKVKFSGVFKYKQIYLGFLAIFFYVGVEVVAADTIVLYGTSQGISFEISRLFTSYTLFFMMLGYLIGIITIPKYIRQDKALAISAILSIIFSVLAIIFSGYTSVLFIAMLGISNAIVWPAIWPLALDKMGIYTKIASSFLIMGILGGALMPLIYGYIADIWGNKSAYVVLFPGYLYILFYALKGHKII